MTAPMTGPLDASQSFFVRREFLDMSLVDAESLDGVVDALEAKAWRAEPGRLPIVVTPNVDIVVQLAEIKNESVSNQFSEGWCVLPDGQPLIMLARRCGVSLEARLAGSSLVAQLWPRLATSGAGVLVLAANDRTASSLRSEHPEAVVVVPPMIDADDPAQVSAVVEIALAATAKHVAGGGSKIDYVFVGIGFPKSALLIQGLLESWPDQESLPVFLGIGASFEMYFGSARRAPEWVQNIGMEWLFRFVQEPRRLFHRYFIRDSKFLVIAAKTYWSSRSSRI